MCQISVPPAEWSLDVFTHERARAWIRAAVGVDGLEPEVLSLGLWKLNATVAERFVQGRVLLCGDAAHIADGFLDLTEVFGADLTANAVFRRAVSRPAKPIRAACFSERSP